MMRNIDKLVLFLINNDDKVTLSKSTATDLETVDKFCEFMINTSPLHLRLYPQKYRRDNPAEF